jgi:phosphate transport system substrate-binding protein
MAKNNTLRLAACTVAAAGLVALTGVHQASAQKKTLVIKGSDTLVNLSQAWAEAYMKTNPSAQISVTGGGTGTGISAFLNGSADIANASREMSGSEIQKAKEKGSIPSATTCALDGLAIAVNAANPLAKISVPELSRIYSGGINDWSQVGGGSGRILALSRETSSGTYVYFREEVLGGKNYRPDALLMPSTKAIATELGRNPRAIGYGGEAYFRGQKGIKIIPVSAKQGGTAVMPSDEAVRNKTYPIARPLYMYTPGKPTGLAAAFIKFTLSPQGQQIVKQVGYTPVK